MVLTPLWDSQPEKVEFLLGHQHLHGTGLAGGNSDFSLLSYPYNEAAAMLSLRQGSSVVISDWECHPGRNQERVPGRKPTFYELERVSWLQ